MIRQFLTILILLTATSSLVSAQKPQKVIRFAEQDVTRLKTLAAKNKKLAPILAKAEARLKVLRALKTGATADPKVARALATFKHNRPVLSCRFSADGQFVFGGAMDKSLHRWNIYDGSQTALQGHESWIRRFDMHPDGELLVTAAYGGRLIWWNPEDATPKPVRSVDAHKGFIRGVAISPNRQFIATGGNDLVVRVWSATTGKLVTELSGHQRHVYNVRFDPSGRFLVSGDLMGVLKQWDTKTWKHVRDLDAKVLTKYDKTFKADCGGIRGMDFSPDGKQLVVCGIGNVTNAFAGVGEPTGVLFDFTTGKRLRVLKPAKKYRGTCWNIRFHPSGKFIVGSGGGSGMLWYWKPTADKAFHSMKVSGCAYDVTFHPDGLRMAVATYNRTLVIYDLGPKSAAKSSKKPKSKRPVKKTVRRKKKKK